MGTLPLLVLGPDILAANRPPNPPLAAPLTPKTGTMKMAPNAREPISKGAQE